MLTIAYLANQFPSAVEPYVVDEIGELRRRGVRVIAGSVRKANANDRSAGEAAEVVLQSLSLMVLLRAFVLCCWRWKKISALIGRALFRGNERPPRRVKALLHTWLAACYAVLLEDRGVDHIHVHHGYFGSWIAMVAASLLDVDFSMTLHGSDLLLHAAYLDVKLARCSFCLTISDYNRQCILERHPEVAPEKIVVSRLGVGVGERSVFPRLSLQARASEFMVLAVGRLNAVKDHAFLLRACSELKDCGVHFECSIAGEGPERRRLESLIRKYGIEERVTLLGHVPRQQMDSLYDRADIVVLTSRSEGIPLVLMEAMARGKIVLAPAITGIPELVIGGKTGFLYEPGSLDDFVDRLQFIQSLLQAQDASSPPAYVLSSARQLDWMRHAAQVQVRSNFSRTKNLERFGDSFLRRIAPPTARLGDENPVLQQVQLSLQRHGSLPLRTDGVDAIAGARSGAVLHV